MMPPLLLLLWWYVALCQTLREAGNGKGKWQRTEEANAKDNGMGDKQQCEGVCVLTWSTATGEEGCLLNFRTGGGQQG